MSSPKAFIPSASKVAQETIAVLVATVVAAWVISKWPAARQLVRENSIPGPLGN